MYWAILVPTKVKLLVRVSLSAYSIRLYSSRHDEERHNHTLEGQQRNMLQGERNAHIHAYMYSFITSSFFLGSYKIIQNTFTTQPKLHDVCDTVCRYGVYNIVFVDPVCTSTTVPLLPRRRLIRFRATLETPSSLPYGVWSPGAHSSREARDARFATIYMPKKVCSRTYNSPKYNFESDAFYDRGGPFRQKMFLSDGAPTPDMIGKPILFRKRTFFVYLGHGIIYRGTT